jgi:intracellular sulfur oxidation DsrE/DsrF family protein
MRAIRVVLVLCVALLSAGVSRAADEIAYLLNSADEPAGIVFEVVEGDGDALQWAIPRIRDYVARLRDKYPGLEIAVVTHGREQFALQSRRLDEYAEVHQGVQSLLGDHVPVHVCGTHAGWYGVEAEDFPAYVDVTPAGPAQINNYEALGWELIRLDAPDN